MDLFIETLTGVSFELKVSPAETVMSIKSKIQRAEGIPVSQQHLIWQDGELDDHRRLRDYSISGGSTIRLVLGLRGGPLNAHRIPPLRLAPLHLAPSLPSTLSKLGRNSSGNRKLSAYPQFVLPSLTSGLLSTGASKSLHDSSAIDHLLDFSSKGTNPSVDDDHTTAGFTHQSRFKLLKETGILLAGSTSHMNCQTFTGSSNHRTSTASQSAPINTSEVSNALLNSNTDNSNLLVDNSSPNPVEPVWANNLDMPSKPESLTNPPINTIDHTTDDRIPDQSILERSIPLGYPPLFPTGTSRSSVNSYDFSSYWRICESRSVSSSLPKAFLVRSSFPLVSTADVDSDSSPPDTAGEQHPQTFDETSKSANRKSPDNSAGEFSGSGSVTATALLAEILSTTGDQLELPCPTSGIDSLFGHSRYPYHWLCKPPLLSENKDFLQQPITSTNLWNSDGIDEDADESKVHPFDVDTERDDDDVDDDDGSSSLLKGSYGYEVDDDDSLADLEDYLLYYRTGDLLFGPPSVAALYPYSYYPIQDAHSSDMEADFGFYTTRTNKDASKYSDGSMWFKECTHMAEKVSDLKSRMKELRIRRQDRQKQRTGEPIRIHSDVIPKLHSTSSEQDSSSSDVRSLSGPGELDSAEISRTPMVDRDPSSSRLSLSTTETPIPRADVRRPRQRRFGTITPPELNSLFPTLRQPNLIPADTGTLPPASDDNDTVKYDISGSRLSSFFPPISLRTGLRRPLSSVVLSSLPERIEDNETNRTRIFSRESNESTDHRLFPSNRSHLSVESVHRSRTSAVSSFPATGTSHDIKGSTHPIPSPPNWCASKIASVNGMPTPELVIDSPLFPAIPFTGSAKANIVATPRSPPKSARSPTSSLHRKRCALCLRKIGIVNSYSCRCGRNFCSRHRYAETHACPYDYKAEARRTLIESNPVVTAPKLPKI